MHIISQLALNVYFEISKILKIKKKKSLWKQNLINICQFLKNLSKGMLIIIAK